MNIFYLDNDPALAAKYHNDKHVVKMPLETAQILSTALFINGVTIPQMYRPTHQNHPCVKWASSNKSNFDWLVKLGKELCWQYAIRYMKNHASLDVITACGPWSIILPDGSFEAPALCMPEIFHTDNHIDSYRDYYFSAKNFGYNKGVEAPDFMKW